MTDVPPPPPPTGPGPSGAASPDAGAALAYGWEKFKVHAGVLIAIIVLPVIVQVALQIVGRFGIDSLSGALVFGVLSMLVSFVAQLGIFNAGLMLTRGEAPEIGKAFSTQRWVEWFVFAFVFGLMVGIGALFCGVGALVVIAFWGLAPYFFLDQGLGLGDSLRKSLETTRSTPGLPLALALTALVGYLGVVLCWVGLLVTGPIAYVGTAFLYRRATGQAVAP